MWTNSDNSGISFYLDFEYCYAHTDYRDENFQCKDICFTFSCAKAVKMSDHNEMVENQRIGSSLQTFYTYLLCKDARFAHCVKIALRIMIRQIDLSVSCHVVFYEHASFHRLN